MKQLPIVGGAPRGERVGSEPEKLRPEVGAPTEICSACGAIVRGAPRGEWGGLPAQSISPAPGSGLPQKICSARGTIVGAATRGECGGQPAQKHKLRPRSGLPQKYAVHAAPLWEPRPAANAEVCPLKSTSFARGRASHRKICSACGAIVGGAPRGEWGGLPAQKHKLRPEVGPPTENMQCRGRHCGIRDPRRMGRSAPSKHKLRPEVGAPTEICSARGAIVGGAPRGECRSARSTAQASPLGRGSHRKYAVHAAGRTSRRRPSPGD